MTFPPFLSLIFLIYALRLLFDLYITGAVFKY